MQKKRKNHNLKKYIKGYLFFILLFIIFATIFTISIEKALYQSPTCIIYDSGILCLDEGYPSDPLGSGTAAHVDMPPVSGICGTNGDFYVKDQTILVAEIPDPLPVTGTYQLQLWYRIGDIIGNPPIITVDELNESFKVICGTSEYEFIDQNNYSRPNEHLPFENGPIDCHFSEGDSEFRIEGIGEHSVHVEQYQITGIVCVPGSSDLRRPGTQVPFFTPLNFLMALLAITLAYLIISLRSKAKTS